MTTAQHTPGPWVVRRGTERDLPRELAPDWESYSIITLPGFGGLTPVAIIATHKHAATHDEAQANAALIAAAPDLLAALEDLADLVQSGLDAGMILSVTGERPELMALSHAQSVIAKVRGQS